LFSVFLSSISFLLKYYNGSFIIITPINDVNIENISYFVIYSYKNTQAITDAIIGLVKLIVVAIETCIYRKLAHKHYKLKNPIIALNKTIFLCCGGTSVGNAP
jgi:hypothetical protein